MSTEQLHENTGNTQASPVGIVNSNAATGCLTKSENHKGYWDGCKPLKDKVDAVFYARVEKTDGKKQH